MNEREQYTSSAPSPVNTTFILFEETSLYNLNLKASSSPLIGSIFASARVGKSSNACTVLYSQGKRKSQDYL